MYFDQYYSYMDELCYELDVQDTYSISFSTFDSNDFEYQQDLALGVFN